MFRSSVTRLVSLAAMHQQRSVSRAVPVLARGFESHPDSTTIIGVSIKDRKTNATPMNQVLSNHGNSIRTRLGLSRQRGAHGLVLLEIYGDHSVADNIKAELNGLAGVEAKSMSFDFIE